MYVALLALHIVSGTLGLLIGPLTMAVRKVRTRRGQRHRHRRLGLAYQAAVAGVCVSTLGLVILHPSVWWLAPIALGTEAAAVLGWLTRPARRTDRVSRHVRLMIGSYIALVTAVAVVNTGSVLAWFLPTLIGTPFNAWVSRRAAARYAGNRVGAWQRPTRPSVTSSSST